MKLYKDIVVDLCKPYPLVVMHVPQYNTAWGARVTLVADGQIIVPDKETINAYIKKPDGEVVYASCTLSGEKILVSFDEQATAVPGPLEVELQLISNGDNLTSPIYQMVVDKSNIDYAMLTSTSEFGALLDALDTVNGLTVIDPANATASDIGMPADAYYTGQALENHETRIAANETAISQQNEKMSKTFNISGYSSIADMVSSAGIGIYIVHGSNNNIKEFSEIGYNTSSWFAGILVKFTEIDYILIGNNNRISGDYALSARGRSDNTSFLNYRIN